jgi:hypothetical protein
MYDEFEIYQFSIRIVFVKQALLPFGYEEFVPARHDVHQISRFPESHVFLSLVTCGKRFELFFVRNFCSARLSWIEYGRKEQE